MFVFLPTIMVKESNSIKLHNGFGLSTKAVFNYCLVFFLSIFFLGIQSLTLVSKYAKQGAPHGNRLVVYPGHFFNDTFHPYTRAFVLSQTPELMEIVDDEVSNDDNSDIEWVRLGHNSLFEKKIKAGAEENLFAQLAESNQNRPTPDLLVLHHSWKNFLS